MGDPCNKQQQAPIIRDHDVLVPSRTLTVHFYISNLFKWGALFIFKGTQPVGSTMTSVLHWCPNILASGTRMVKDM